MEQWPIDDIIIPGNLLNCVSHLHENGVGFMQFCENICCYTFSCCDLVVTYLHDTNTSLFVFCR